MKYHAILIQTHANVELLKMVIQRMKSENHYFFVHVDKKNKNYTDFLKLASKHVIFTDKRFDVKCGSIEQVYLTLELIKTAKTTEIPFDYYHLISGQDFPIRKNAIFDAIFENNNKSYMEVDNNTPYSDRFMFFHLNGIINVRSKWGRRIEKYSILIQKIINRNIRLRNKLEIKTYKGNNWWSLNSQIIDYIINFLKNNPHYTKRFRFTSCCDEVFFHTIIFNSPLKNTVELHDLRYIDWHKTYPSESTPRTLTEKDYNKILSSNAVFMRKIDIDKSYLLIKKILQS